MMIFIVLEQRNNIMIKGFKIRLLPTKEQEELMIKSIGCSRFAYNWALNKIKERRWKL